MSFQKTAQEIINRSIKSAIYIDDKIAIPFKDDTTNASYKLCSEVYESFDQNNTALKFYEFKNLEQWNKNKNQLLQSKDLLVLDWNLQTQDPKFLDALHILRQAIQTENIFSVVIYTVSPENERPNILHNICYYFSTSKLDLSLIKPNIENKIDEWSIEPTFISDSLGNLITLVIAPDRARETLKEIRKIYGKALGEYLDDFENFLKEIFETESIMKAFKTLGFVFNDCLFPRNPLEKIDIEINEDYSLINNTYIFVEHKIDTTQLYTKIKTAIINSSKNFLPLMGLEMRNVFNESSALMAKEISSIDEYAFLHHQDSVKPKEAFYEFLKELWKDQSFNFLDYDNKLNLFSELESYRKERKISRSTIKDKINKGELDKDLGRLNCFYNLLVDSKTGRKIRFGDIFRVNKADNYTNRYLLCITALCDCLYPENLSNNFYFVEGNKYNITKGLMDGDEGFNTFIEDESTDEIICIKWKNKPFTIHISDENNNISSDIAISIGLENYKVKYIATLKENYAQRMANRAFTHPLHVGIFFVDKKENKVKK